MLKFCQKIPKFELHSHLSGSIRNSTIFELIKNSQLYTEYLQIIDSKSRFFFFPKSKRTTSECFYIFNLIHHLTNNLNIIKRITREVIEDYSKENTKYLEIRTTPRKLEENNSLKYNKREYIEAILEEINTYKTNFPENFYDINLILSIDRSNSNLNALETVILILNKGSFGKRV
jgi:adenosine deaminase